MYFKRRHDQEETDFFKTKTKDKITVLPQTQTGKRGISLKKKNLILSQLGSLIASSTRRTFLKTLPSMKIQLI